MIGPLVALALCATPSIDARFPHGLTPMRLPPIDANCGSGSCHAKEVAAHALSAHAVARSNFIFQAGVKEDQPEWCVGCHAPLSRDFSARAPPDATAEEAGVTCVACHAGTRGVLATRDSGTAPHAVEVSTSLRDGTLCAGCHQFGFLVRDARHRPKGLAPRLQQDTVGEWLAWTTATGQRRSCWGCHSRGTDHALSGHRATEAVSRAIDVNVVEGALEISSRAVGHAFPTGDVMRWLSVEFSTDGFTWAAPAARFGTRLGTRRWPHEPEPRQGVVEDTRLRPGQLRRVAIPDGATAWQVVYHLVSEGQETRGNMQPDLSRNVLQAGSLTPREAP